MSMYSTVYIYMYVNLCSQRVQQALSPGWLAGGVPSPYLRHSPAAPFLVNYFPDGVGMSASEHPRTTATRRAVGKKEKAQYSGKKLLI